MENLSYQKFSQINLNDPFFSTLKADYVEFPDWFAKKAREDESAYVLYNRHGVIEGFMYLKIEVGEITDTNPPLPNATHLKIGTFKFDSAGTRRGERFIKKVFDHAIEYKVDDIYVTIFDKHEYLIILMQRYGFNIIATKETANGNENVLFRKMSSVTGDILHDYPKFETRGNSKYLMSIYPDYHTRMLPDSILNNESHDLIQDVSHTNSIHKIYLCAMEGTSNFKPGDIIVTYRTTDRQGPARYRSVITSVCVVEEYKNIGEFNTLECFLRYAGSYSVFSTEELTHFYRTKRYPHIIRFTYNTAMTKRVIRGRLIDEVGLSDGPGSYWGVMRLTDQQFHHMLDLGELDASFIIN
ncbi:TPA: N-acetyltransferase [Vibrio cholerae]|uniref:N-acetyltransferase n=1 Tax=Vibrio cholerae TaxID=666 RepID=UPI0011D55616|nr:N-acetyltransferase [Vibrio cholerae]EGR2427006.1 N-acetyltransferase [Vibrio cholerae]ELJ8562456.1 N-acetyltransferase [Vibrio cholerae]TXZ70629.1 N-acetyltransferase [Vibrio cholerae]GHZ77349.1 acetyltransferase [Vibrio cholerae]HDL9485719.1 N-acetyltransferase [Vibrio cholerae]